MCHTCVDKYKSIISTCFYVCVCVCVCEWERPALPAVPAGWSGFRCSSGWRRWPCQCGWTSELQPHKAESHEMKWVNPLSNLKPERKHNRKNGSHKFKIPVVLHTRKINFLWMPCSWISIYARAPKGNVLILMALWPFQWFHPQFELLQMAKLKQSGTISVLFVLSNTFVLWDTV